MKRYAPGLAVLVLVSATSQIGAQSGPEARRPSGVVAPAPAAGVADTGTGAPGKWRKRVTRSERDRLRTAILMLEAENEVISATGGNRPTLVIRCRGGATEVYVVAGVNAETKYGTDNQVPVSWRLDGSPAQAETWSASTTYLSFFSPSPSAFARQLSRTHTMIFEFTPFRSAVAVARFDMRGLVSHLQAEARACGLENQALPPGHGEQPD